MFVSQTDSCDLKLLPREINENCALMGHYSASGGNSSLTFREKLSVSSSRVKNLTVKSGLIGCHTTCWVRAQKDAAVVAQFPLPCVAPVFMTAPHSDTHTHTHTQTHSQTDAVLTQTPLLQPMFISKHLSQLFKYHISHDALYTPC